MFISCRIALPEYLSPYTKIVHGYFVKRKLIVQVPKHEPVLLQTIQISEKIFFLI